MYGKGSNSLKIIHSMTEVKLPLTLKAKQGRMGLLRTATWWSNTYRLKGKRKWQRRGKRAGSPAKLKANCKRPAVPSLFLAKVQALDNKIDLLQLRVTAHQKMRNCCVLY